MFQASAIRDRFPFFSLRPELTYFDTAATAQKPRCVLDAVTEAWTRHNANVHRGVHGLGGEATDAYERARDIVRRFIGAAQSQEIIFTKNATEAINLVAHAWARRHLRKGDIVALSVLEHHSNIVPWLQLKREAGIELQWIDIDDHGEPRIEDAMAAWNKRPPKLLAITGQSNVLGVRPDLSALIPAAHACGARVLVDAAQLIVHGTCDVERDHIDFLAFSGHKIYGPTGIGVLYAREDVQREMSDFLGGGSMIADITRRDYTAADAPHRFEAGTPPIAEAIGLGAALSWLQTLPHDERIAHEQTLTAAAFDALSTLPGIRIPGPADPAKRHGCISFTLEGIHPHDLTDLLGQRGFCLRAGHHCARILHERLDITASTRLSLGLYNTLDDIERLIPAIEQARARFHRINE